MTRRQILKIGALGLAVPALRVRVQAAPEALEARLDGVLQKSVESEEIAGAVLRVLRGGEVVYERAVGLSNRESPTQTRLDTVFRLASMTKGIVSAATLALVEEGKLGLDDPVARYLPRFRPTAPGRSSPGARITVRQLLTHTSGLGYGFFQPPGSRYEQLRISDGLDAPELSLQENLRRLAQAPLLAAPGEKWIYSLSTDVLGAVLSVATGESLPALVRRTICGPLGMEETVFAPGHRLAPRLAVPYAKGERGLSRVLASERVLVAGSALRLDPRRALSGRAYPSGGAGMVGTASDYTRFLEAIRLGGALEGSRILSARITSLLTTNQIGSLPVDAAGPGFGWSLAFAVLLDPRQAKSPMSRGAFHWGGVWGSSFWVDPARQLSVVLLTNTTPAGMLGPLPDAIRAAIYNSAST